MGSVYVKQQGEFHRLTEEINEAQNACDILQEECKFDSKCRAIVRRADDGCYRCITCGRTTQDAYKDKSSPSKGNKMRLVTMLLIAALIGILISALLTVSADASVRCGVRPIPMPGTTPKCVCFNNGHTCTWVMVAK